MRYLDTFATTAMLYAINHMNRFPFNIWILMLAAIVIVWAFMFNSASSAPPTQPYNEFLEALAAKKVSSIEVDGAANNGSA